MERAARGRWLIEADHDLIKVRSNYAVLETKYRDLLKAHIQLLKDAKAMRDALEQFADPYEEVTQALAWFQVHGWEESRYE